MSMQEDVAARIARYRKAQNLSQDELGRLSGLSQNIIWRLETNRMPVRLTHLEAIAPHLAVSPADFLPPQFLGDRPRETYSVGEDAERYIPPSRDDKSPPNRPDLQGFLTDNAPNRIAWTLRSQALTAQGHRPGDILVVDTDLKPIPGDIVCAQIYGRDDARTVFRLFQPPYLMTSSIMGGPLEAQIIDAQRVRIVGPVVSAHREMR